MGQPRSGTTGRARDEIVHAVVRDEVGPVFQPIVDLRSGLVAGYEALSRFARGSREVGAWFGEAHACGLGPRLEAHTANLALHVPRRPFGAALSLNVAPATLVSDEFSRVLPDRLDGLVLELTGVGAPLADEVLREACTDIRDRGGRLAVDQDGPDHTNLRALLLTHPDMVKLDPSLVQGVSTDKPKAAIVAALVGYARELGISVCGEAVESLDDAERLAELDVTYAQGHALGRPAPPWAGADSEAARRLQSSTAASVTGHAHGVNARLEWLTLRLSEATGYAELDEAVDAIGAELGADDVAISRIDGEELVVIGRTGDDRSEARVRIADFPLTADVLREQRAVQVLANDPDADLAETDLLRELGHRSVLMLPVSCAGRPIGLFEAYTVTGRPFSRFEIGRARIIALQLGATLERLSRG